VFDQAKKKAIIVFGKKDEAFARYAEKLLLQKDDTEDGIVGVEDGFVEFVVWDEDFYLQQKGIHTREKILFIGNCKSLKALKPSLDVKYSQFGVEYGWAGNKAAIYTSDSRLKRDEYNQLIASLQETDIKVKDQKKKNALSKETVGKAAVLAAAPFIGGVFTGVPMIALFVKNAFSDKEMVKQQQLFYGLLQLYLNDLQGFLEE